MPTKALQLVCVVLSLAVTSVTATAETDVSAGRGEVTAVFLEWETAVSALDVDRVMKLHAPNFLQYGLTHKGIRSFYEAELRHVKAVGAELKAEVDVKRLDFGADGWGDYCKADLVLFREMRLGKVRLAERYPLHMMLRRIDGAWKFAGTGSRTLCTAQVGYDGKRYHLILRALSPDALFPVQVNCSGRILGVKTLLAAPAVGPAGMKGVWRRVLLDRKPKAGDQVTFEVPYPQLPEEVAVPVGAPVEEVPTVLMPVNDYEIKEWPLKIRWRGVSARVPDFSRYEVHIRRPADHSLVYAFRGLPWDANEFVLGDDAGERALFQKPHEPYVIELYAYDVNGNFSVALTRVYDLTHAAR